MFFNLQSCVTITTMYLFFPLIVSALVARNRVLLIFVTSAHIPAWQVGGSQSIFVE